MKKRFIDFTPEELAEYNHARYMKKRQKRLEYQKQYYLIHSDEIRRKANLRYRRKCGLI